MKNNFHNVRFSLIDYSNEDNPAVFTRELAYSQAEIIAQVAKDMIVKITIGDLVTSSIVSLPFGMLSQAMLELTTEHQNHKSKGLVGFNKPGIIGLN